MRIEIVSYTATKADQSGSQGLARIIMHEKGKKPTFNPVFIEGQTAAEAEIKAGAWWDGELKKERDKLEANAKRAEGRRKALAEPKAAPAITPVVEDEEEGV